MLPSRSGARRAALLAVLVLVLGSLAVVPISAANASVTGSLTFLEQVALSPNAVAIVTIVDQTAAPDAGAVIGEERIDAPTTVPIDFAVLVDAAAIDPTHAYALFATIVDGTSTWQNLHGEPVITGGPTQGINLVLPAAAATPKASVTGTIVPPPGTALGPAAVSIAALIKVETGTLVSRQVRPIADAVDLGFSIGFDPTLIDPTATYVVKGGIIDGATVWQNREGAPAIANGVPASPVSLPVTLVQTGLPVASAFPTPVPSQSARPTTAPTATPTAAASPTARASATAAPTATPAPTASPTPLPTASPTPSTSPTPSASPTLIPTPSATPAPSSAPTPSPISGPVTGTLTYREPYTLTADAFAVVALVRGTARANESSIVASEIDRDVSAIPVSFSLAVDQAEIDPSVTYTIQATIVDGENAWVTSHGVPVLTKGNPANVAITLTYRPDLLKGAVTGQITAIGLQPSANAYAMAVLVDPSTGGSLGIDVEAVTKGLPVAFAIPYTVTDIDPTQDYVVTAEVGDSGTTWRNVAGVPVLTKGNPKTAIQVVVTQVVIATPSPAPTAVPTATPAPTPGRTGDYDLLGIIILIVAIGAVVAFFIARGQGRTDASITDPTATGATAAATGTEASTEADSSATADTPAEGSPPSDPTAGPPDGPSSTSAPQP